MAQPLSFPADVPITEEMLRGMSCRAVLSTIRNLLNNADYQKLPPQKQLEEVRRLADSVLRRMEKDRD